MFNEKIDKMVEAAPEFLKKYIGICDDNNEIYKTMLTNSMTVFEIIRNESEYISEMNGVYVLLNNRLHEFYINMAYPGSGLGNHIPMAICAGPGMVDILDNLVIVNTKFCEMDQNMQVFMLLHELGHILCGDSFNEIAADKYACQHMEEGVGKQQLERLVKMIEDACKGNPQYRSYVESVKIRLEFI